MLAKKDAEDGEMSSTCTALSAKIRQLRKKRLKEIEELIEMIKDRFNSLTGSIDNLQPKFGKKKEKRKHRKVKSGDGEIDALAQEMEGSVSMSGSNTENRKSQTPIGEEKTEGNINVVSEMQISKE